MKTNIITPTSVFKKFKDFNSKLKYLGSNIIKNDNDIYYIIPNKLNNNIIESFIQVKTPELSDFYNWIIFNPFKLYNDIKNNELLVKNTSVDDSDNENLFIYKNLDKVITIPRLGNGNIFNKDNINNIIFNKYKKLPLYIDTLLDKKFNWEEIKNIDSVMYITSPVKITLAKSIFPLIKNIDKLSIGYIGEDKDISHKVYIAFKEEYPTFNIYSICAIMNILK